MRRKLLITISLFLMSMMIVTQVYAHGEDSQPEPTAQAASITIPNSQPNSINETGIVISPNIESSAFDSQLLTIMGSLILSAIVVATTWFITQGQLPGIAVGIGILISYTAFIHITFGLSGDLLLIANGMGYLIWYILRSVPRIRLSRFFNWLDIVFIAYTLITFVGYFALHDHIELVGLTSKVAEVLLVGFLIYRIFAMNPTSTTPAQIQVG